jgi:hypothetical protein
VLTRTVMSRFVWSASHGRVADHEQLVELFDWLISCVANHVWLLLMGQCIRELDLGRIRGV